MIMEVIINGETWLWNKSLKQNGIGNSTIKIMVSKYGDYGNYYI